jgi:hypothetical protein
LIASVREEKGDLPTVICGQVGSRGYGYEPSELMSTEEAESYHAEQIAVYASTEAAGNALTFILIVFAM